jgi:hypothetical protein
MPRWQASIGVLRVEAENAAAAPRQSSYLIDQQRGRLGHAPGSPTGTYGPAFATERHELLGVALLALHAQEAVLEASALQVRLELLLHVFGQRPAGGCTRGEQLRVVLLDEPVEEGLLVAVARSPADR